MQTNNLHLASGDSDFPRVNVLKRVFGENLTSLSDDQHFQPCPDFIHPDEIENIKAIGRAKRLQMQTRFLPARVADLQPFVKDVYEVDSVLQDQISIMVEKIRKLEEKAYGSYRTKHDKCLNRLRYLTNTVRGKLRDPNAVFINVPPKIDRNTALRIEIAQLKSRNQKFLKELASMENEDGSNDRMTHMLESNLHRTQEEHSNLKELLIEQSLLMEKKNEYFEKYKKDMADDLGRMRQITKEIRAEEAAMR